MLNKFSKWLMFFVTLLFVSDSFARITLTNGSYYNRTMIDTALRTANLNFTYEGCNPNPNPNQLRLTTDGQCRDARNYNLEREGGNTTVSGRVGEVLLEYVEVERECENPVSVQLSSNYSLQDIYQSFHDNDCQPTHIVIRDSTADNHNRIVKEQRVKELCRLKDTKINFPGFPTSAMNILNVSANIDGFNIGDASKYRYDPEQGWCITYRSNEPKCGEWASPVPIAYRDAQGQYQMKAIIGLGSDGTATIGAVNKSYPTYEAMFNDLRSGNVRADVSQGYLNYHTWTKSNGVRRAAMRAYDGDQRHLRTINFFGRNVFGRESTQHWCNGENCFIEAERPPLSQHRCSNEPEINMTNGGSGNLCYSCVGITPGMCAVRQQDRDQLRRNLPENDGFSLTRYGEYAVESSQSLGLQRTLSDIVNRPERPGCHRGHAQEDLGTFIPSGIGTDVPIAEPVTNAEREPDSV
ncbi:MAG: hypothetical protein MJK18_03345, partial [Bdellovibrionales bacterium]|nr:hypothetical protein [Bdellovibrionales bacterium]